jgi:signal transduction histidine kinase
MKSATENLSGFGLHVMDLELNKTKSMIDNFIYSCSHAMRSPLKTMEGLVRLAKQHPTPNATDWQTYMNLIGHSAERMQAILKHFQELKRNAEIKPEPQLVNLAELLLNVLDTFKPQMEASGITSQLHINQKGEMVLDVWRLETIFKNVLSNAIAFYDASKEKRDVQVFVTASASSCSILIHDNGIGIDPSEHKKIFNLFYRGTQQSKGAGMGLFIAQQLTEKLKGTVSMRSTPDHGSTFSIWLPNQSKR